MSSHKPHTATILCVPSKIKDGDGKPYPGGYPAGLLEDIRTRLCLGPSAAILHMPGGWADNYNNGCNWGYGMNDQKADIDPSTRPDFCFDCRGLKKHIFEAGPESFGYRQNADNMDSYHPCENVFFPKFKAVIIDRDYDPRFADKHASGAATWPTDSQIEQVARDCFDTVLAADGLVVLFDKKPLRLGPGYRQLWTVGVVISGGRQDMRVYTVWTRDWGVQDFPVKERKT